MHVACVLADDFEDSEFRGPHDALRKAGHDVTVVGLKAGTELRGKKGKERVTADRGIDQVSAGDFDALLIPGGYSPDHLRADRRMVDFARAFFANERPVFAICHGPQLLMTARVVRGRRMTAWMTVQDDLSQVGADVVDGGGGACWSPPRPGPGERRSVSRSAPTEDGARVRDEILDMPPERIVDRA